MKSLTYYVKGYLKEAILGPLFKLLEALFELMVPLIIAQIVDSIIPQHNSHDLYLMIGLLFGLATIGVIVAISAQYFSAKAAVGYTRVLSQDLYKHIIQLSQENRDKLTSSSLITRLSSDTYQIQTGINQFLRLFLRAPIIVFGAIIMAFSISPSITIDFLIMVTLLFLIVIIMSRQLNPLYAKIRLALEKIVTQTREQLEGMRVIRAFNQLPREEAVFASANDAYTNLQMQAGFWSSLVTPLTYIVVNGTLMIILWQGNVAVGKGVLSQGLLIALVNYLLQILTELLKMTMLVTSLNQSFISAKRVQEVFDRPVEPIDEQLEVMYSSDYAIVIEDMSFRYPTSAEPALNHLDIKVQTGDFLGIIGGTGAGKSSLVHLLSCLYRPQKGILMLYHHGKSPASMRQWRDMVRVVPQKAELFQGTIRSNLTLGLSDSVSDEELWRALEMAQAKDFVSEKEGQLDAVVSAFGRNFSGGQRQRLTIARALVKKTPFLILDDATSALDYVTEAKLLNSLKELKNTTVVMISQRTNSLRQADTILVLDQGYQAGFANHETLLKENDLYQAIHASQHQKGEANEG
ncbi:ABC transporter ATP-binding protein [Streptococcus sp. zg-JUN1979]|uniref:ABC transporter ATP-binding protein n=1 Tax=Streptococcus sp. zg-JUN1979 TaxID=3391450 RepID=UPI0039A50782